MALPEFQVKAPESPRPLDVKLEVPVPRIESLLGELESPRTLLVARERRESDKA